MKLCLKCCECVKRFDGKQWTDVCNVTGCHIDDIENEWTEGDEPSTVCDTYCGPIGFDFDEWNRKFEAALVSALSRAIDEGTVRQSEVVRALCK